MCYVILLQSRLPLFNLSCFAKTLLSPPFFHPSLSFLSIPIFLSNLFQDFTHTHILPETVKMGMLCFRLPGHGDTTLKHMNSLRSKQHFCDITIVASGSQTFRGHKVVLAACSPFLRDQFLLNPSSKLQVQHMV